MRGLQTPLGRASGLVTEWHTVFRAIGDEEDDMTVRPPHLAAYEFVVVSALRAHQLLAGCTPRLPGTHAAATMAQMEVAGGCIERDNVDEAASARLGDGQV